MSRFQSFTLISIIFLTLSTFGLWYIQNQSLNELKADISQIQANTPTTSTPTYNSTATTESDAEQPDTIQSQLDLLTSRLDNIENIPTPTTTTPKQPKSAPFQKQVLTLGSSSTTSRQWVQTGLEITINSADYPSNVVMSFEAGLSIINGIAWARLTNKTTGAIIDISEVSSNTSDVSWIGSPQFQIHPGNNTYVVELKSTSGETAYLSSSRIAINED